MTATGKAILIGAVTVFVLVLTLVASAVGWYNDAVSLEESTKAQFRDNKNEYDAFWKKVKEVAQVPEQYKEDFKDILVSETAAKFGDQGSQAMFQWFKDRNINFDASLYTKVQNVIESGRDDFKRSQTLLLDKQRKYSVHVKSVRGKILSGITGMPNAVHGELAPRSDLDGDGVLTVLDYPIVTSKRTEKAFADGADDEINVFGN